MKVKATAEYKNRKVIDSELNRIPEAGEIFEVSEERYKVLTKSNKYGVKFVELAEQVKENGKKIAKAVKEVETAKKESKVEKAVKKTTKKSK